VFYKDPRHNVEEFTQTYYSHLVVADVIFEATKDILKDYKVIGEFFHAFTGETPLGYQRNIYYVLLEHSVITF